MGEKGQCSPRSAHLAPSTQKASFREAFRGYKWFLCSQAFCLGRAVTKTGPASAGKKGRENMLILDQKEPHLFASCASASQRGHGQELMFAIHTVLSGKAGPGEAIGHSYASSWQIILVTDVLP